MANEYPNITMIKIWFPGLSDMQPRQTKMVINVFSSSFGLAHLKVASLIECVWWTKDGHLPVVQVRLFDQCDAESLHWLLLKRLQLHHQGLLGAWGGLVGHSYPTFHTNMNVGRENKHMQSFSDLFLYKMSVLHQSSVKHNALQHGEFVNNVNRDYNYSRTFEVHTSSINNKTYS